MSTARYTDKTYIGSGGMASVYKAFDEVLQRPVAVKEMIEQKRGNESVRHLFLDEARKMALIKHQNVVQVYDVIDDGGVPTIIMEFIDGGSLATQMGVGALAAEEVLKMLEQVVSGLKAIHDAGFVHRDVKPENILNDNGTYKITDFGVAMRADDDTLPFVTNKYAAPEVLLDPGKINPSSDLYSIGIMAIEMLLGPREFEDLVRETIEGDTGLQLPAIKDSVQAFWQQWVGGTAELPNLHDINRAISPELSRFLADLVARKQSERIQDCDTLLSELRMVKRLESQRAAGETQYDDKLAKRVEKAKATRNSSDSAAAPPKQKRQRPLWFKVSIGIGGVLLAGIAWLLMFAPEPAFQIEVATEPSGASVTVNGHTYEDIPTPMYYGGNWGDVIVLQMDGREPVELTLTPESVTETEDGVLLEATFPDAPELRPSLIATSAEAATILSEKLPREWPIEITLSGQEPPEGVYAVEVGTPLRFSVASQQPGTLTMLHLGADNSLTRIYPSPAGAVLRINSSEATEVGSRLNLVAREPLGREWIVFLVTQDDYLPANIDGSIPVSDWAMNYPFGEVESPGHYVIQQLLEAIDANRSSGMLIPMDIVAAGGSL